MPDLSAVTVTQLIDAMTVQSPKGRTLQMHCRSSYALSFCYAGKITYTHYGKDFVSDRGHAVLLPRGASYHLYRNETGSFPLINFQCENLPMDTFLVIPLHNPESYLADYEQLKDRLLFPQGRAGAMSIFYDMLHRLNREGNTANAILAPAMSALEIGFGDSTLSNSLLAEKCGISEVYFRQLFREALGTSPKQYILELRIRKAKQLLTGSRLPVNRIAEECGFASPYHFSRAFHQSTGLTPSEYRKEHMLLIL